MAGSNGAPKVFISYSHDSPEHQTRVLELSDRLRRDGVDAVVDQYEPAPPEGWPHWTERQIEDADFVLLICTETYLRRVQHRNAAGAGLGVMWEATLIYNRIYAGGSLGGKFVPVLLDEGAEQFIPVPIRGVTCYTVSADDGYSALYRHLTHSPGASKAALGRLRSLPAAEPRTDPTQQHRHRQLHRFDATDDRNRRSMLARVHHDWIQGVLERSMSQAGRLDLVVESAPDAVEKRFRTDEDVRPPTAVRLAEPSGIVDVFDEHVGALLILGPPGSGKTTLLLELARALHLRADEDRRRPIPVIFNLSTWPLRRRALAAWLVDELNERYDVPFSVAQTWVDEDEILPLLDGLDEVDASDRAGCVSAINEFRRQNGFAPIVVCSREAEYHTLNIRLRLAAAIVIRPLTVAQVQDYLERAGEPFRALRESALRDSSIVALLQTPLTVNIMRLAREDPSGDVLGGSDEVTIDRKHLMRRYVDGVLRRRPSGFGRDAAAQWLSRLAGMMARQNQTVFNLENLRPEWLRSARQRRFATCTVWVIVALFGVVVFGVTDAAFLAIVGPANIVASESPGVSAALLRALFDPFNPVTVTLEGACAALLAGTTTCRLAPQLSLSWRHVRRAAVHGAFWGSVAGARLGIVLGALSGAILWLSLPDLPIAARLLFSPLMAIGGAALYAMPFSAICALGGGLAGSGLAMTFGPRMDGSLFRAAWSPGALRRGALVALRRGVGIGAPIGTLAALSLSFVAPPDGTEPLSVSLFLLGVVAAAGAIIGALAAMIAGALTGLAFFATTLPSVRSLASVVVALAPPRDVGPVDRVHWSWRHLRNGWQGAIQYALVGGVLGCVLNAPAGALIGALATTLAESIASPFGPVAIAPFGVMGRGVFVVESLLWSGMTWALSGAALGAIFLVPLGFIEGMLVRTNLDDRSGPNQGTIRSARAAVLSSLFVGIAFATIHVPLEIIQILTVGWTTAGGGHPIVLLAALGGAQLGIVFAAVRNGGHFCIQHLVVRAVCWWTGDAPWRYTRFLDDVSGQLPLLYKVGGGYMFIHRLVLEHFAALDSHDDQSSPDALATRAAV